LVSVFIKIAIAAFESLFLVLALVLLFKPDRGVTVVRWMVGKKWFDRSLPAGVPKSVLLTLGWGWLLISLLALVSTLRSFTNHQ